VFRSTRSNDVPFNESCRHEPTCTESAWPWNTTCYGDCKNCDSQYDEGLVAGNSFGVWDVKGEDCPTGQEQVCPPSQNGCPCQGNPTNINCGAWQDWFIKQGCGSGSG